MFRALPRWRAANRFDIVAVGIEHKSSVIVRVVVWADPGLSVVFAAGRDGFLIKPVDGRPVLCGKGDMRSGLRYIAYSDPEAGFRANAIAREPFAVTIQPRDAQRT